MGAGSGVCRSAASLLVTPRLSLGLGEREEPGGGEGL